MNHASRFCGPMAALALAIGASVAACDRPSDPFVGPDGPGSSRLTNRTLIQRDHFGLPAINTVFIPSGEKDEYNRTAPSPAPTDVERYRGFIAGFLAFLESENLRQGASFTPDQLAGVLYPDAQPLDFPDAVLATGGPLSGFPDGRRLEDDVIDTALFLIFGSTPGLTSDNVDGNDATPLSAFPYLADPHTP